MATERTVSFSIHKSGEIIHGKGIVSWKMPMYTIAIINVSFNLHQRVNKG